VRVDLSGMHWDVRRVHAPLGHAAHPGAPNARRRRARMHNAPDRATVGVERVTAFSAVGSGVPVAGMDQGLPIVVGGFFTCTGPIFLKQLPYLWFRAQPGEVLLDLLPPEGAEVTDFFS